MEKVELSIVALAQSETQTNSFIVLLKEEEGARRLPIVIGGFEAQAIALAVEGIHPNRPLTHDLFTNTMRQIGVDLKEIVISDLRQGIFFATLVCQVPDGTIVELDSRTSDALALAVRFSCPIYTYAFILDRAGVSWETRAGETQELGQERTEPQSGQPLNHYSDEDLEQLLDSALRDEDYERAAEIRDEIRRREGEN
jgi:bifunctional DNase/RNase